MDFKRNFLSFHLLKEFCLVFSFNVYFCTSICLAKVIQIVYCWIIYLLVFIIFLEMELMEFNYIHILFKEVNYGKKCHLMNCHHYFSSYIKASS